MDRTLGYILFPWDSFFISHFRHNTLQMRKNRKRKKQCAENVNVLMGKHSGRIEQTVYWDVMDMAKYDLKETKRQHFLNVWL